MAATNAQVQNFSDQRMRVRSESLRQLFAAIDDDVASIGEVYANLTSTPDWTDVRSDAPPTLLTPNDLLAINTAYVAIKALKDGTTTAIRNEVAASALSAEAKAACALLFSFADQYPVIQKACVRPFGI